MLRLFMPQCRKCQEHEAVIDGLKHELQSERDRRLSEKIKAREARRRERADAQPSWLDALAVAEDAVREALAELPERSHGWSYPGARDAWAIEEAKEQILKWEALIDVVRKEFIGGLGKQLDRMFPGNVISEALTENNKLMLLRMKEEVSKFSPLKEEV